MFRGTTLPSWIFWGFPLAFLIHDGEEALVIAARGYGVTSLFTRVETSVIESIAAITVELVLVCALSYFAWRRIHRDPAPRPSPVVYAFAVLLAAWTVHGLIIHLVQFTVEKHYTMGVITAVPACIVYGGWALYRLYRLGWVSKRWLAVAPFIGILAFLPLLGIAHEAGRLIG